jgi:UDP-N-acetylmuramate: L-alanyl-gamma-D-glutamyl-meso-diaminopimelate ligase
MKLHFISIGGNVMHQLAIALSRKGYQISGSDDEIVDPARSNLQKEGLLPSQLGWNPELITNELDGIILGMHAREDNPELIKATQLGLQIYSFPEYIYHESLQKKRIVIGGSHGKTTTTAMIMHLLQQQQMKFDYLVGAAIKGFPTAVQLTEAPLIVCEGDEYPASAIHSCNYRNCLGPY